MIPTDKLALFSAVEDFIKSNHGKAVLAVDPNGIASGTILAYVGGEGKPYEVTTEQLEKFIEAKATSLDKKPE